MATFSTLSAFWEAVEDGHREAVADNRGRVSRDMARRGQRIARQQAARDLGGDPKFSGWRPRLATVVRPLRGGGSILMPTRSSAGPWTVASVGRNRGNASGFAGPGVNRRTGVTSRTQAGNLRKVRKSRGKKWNGYTSGFGTGQAAVARMERELPEYGESEAIKVVRKSVDVD